MAKANTTYLANLQDDSEIIDQIFNGVSQADIARALKVNAGDLSRWLNSDDKRSARVREARKHSSEVWMDKAAQALMDIPDDAANGAITRQKELAQLYKRQAAIRNPAEYGDKIDVSGKIDHVHSVSSLFSQIVQQPNLLPLEDAILIESGNTKGNTE